MGSHPNLNTVNSPAPAEGNQTNPSVGTVLGSQTVSLPKSDYARPLAMPIYVGSTPIAPPQTPPQAPIQVHPMAKANTVEVPSLPVTPPWMIFQQNAVRVPTVTPSTQNIAPNIPAMGNTAIPPMMPAQPQQGQQLSANPTQVPPTQTNGTDGTAVKQPPDQGTEKQGDAKQSEEAKTSTASTLQDDAMSQDTIRSMNSRLNNSVQSVRVAAAGDFLTLVAANPELTNNPRYHDIIDAFLEKMLKDPSGDVRAAAYRSLESIQEKAVQNGTPVKVSQSVYDLLKQRSENDGVFGVETDSINTILAGVSVEKPPEQKDKEKPKTQPSKKEIHQEARQKEKAEQKQEKQAKEDAHNGKVPVSRPVQGQQESYGLAV